MASGRVIASMIATELGRIRREVSNIPDGRIHAAWACEAGSGALHGLSRVETRHPTGRAGRNCPALVGPSNEERRSGLVLRRS